MELLLQRWEEDERGVVGKLFVDNVFECWTLEPALDRPTHPAIPPGKYQVDITFSPRFKRQLPELENVPGRSNIRIHAGNTEADTEGCILVGQGCEAETLEHSQLALSALLPKITSAITRGESVDIIVQEEVKED